MNAQIETSLYLKLNIRHSKKDFQTYPPFCLRRMDEFDSRSWLNLAADTSVLVEELIDLSNDDVRSLLPLFRATKNNCELF